MNETVYNPVLDFLADHKPRTIAQIEQAVAGKGVSLAQVVQALVLLTGAGHISALQEDATINKVRKQVERTNAYLMNKARSSSDIVNLASPVTGGGVTVGRFPQLFLLAMQQNRKNPADWAAFAWQTVSAQGQKLLKEGKALETPEVYVIRPR